MNTVTPFNYNEHAIRTLTDEAGDIWFVGKDVAEVPGYENGSRDIDRHCKATKLLKSTDSVPLEIPPHGLLIIPERDVYRLIMKSKLPAAEAFEEWVAGTVLPTLRKTGEFMMPDFSNPAKQPRDSSTFLDTVSPMEILPATHRSIFTMDPWSLSAVCQAIPTVTVRREEV